jgi:hypothetical protein
MDEQNQYTIPNVTYTNTWTFYKRQLSVVAV